GAAPVCRSSVAVTRPGRPVQRRTESGAEPARAGADLPRHMAGRRYGVAVRLLGPWTSLAPVERAQLCLAYLSAAGTGLATGRVEPRHSSAGPGRARRRHNVMAATWQVPATTV